MAICLERGADLHLAQLMPLPLTVSRFSKIQIGFTFLVLAHQVVPEKGPLNVRVLCVTARSGDVYSVVGVIPSRSACTALSCTIHTATAVLHGISQGLQEKISNYG